MPETSTKLIKKILKSRYKTTWREIVSHYKSELDRPRFRSEQAYTDHSYSTHCVNIFSNIEMFFGSQIEKLTIDECFLLAVGVALHDYIMSKDARDDARNAHSFIAFDYIKNRVASQSDSFIAKKLTDNELEAVAYIILGHSDIKTKQGPVKTMEKISDKNELSGKMTKQPIRLRLVAAILRICDELDITRDRIGTNRITPLDDVNKESLPHHRKLELIKSLKCNSDTRIEAFIDDDKVEGDSDIDMLVDVKKKVTKEINYINKLVFDNLATGEFAWRIRYIEYSSDKGYNEEVEAKINSASHSLLTTPSALEGHAADPAAEEESGRDLSSELDAFIVKNHLFIDGHFKVDDKNEKVRDWIDVHKILLNRDMLKLISVDFIKKFHDLKIDDKNILIIGLDFPGMVISSCMAFNLGLPFTYYITDKYMNHHDEAEIKVSLDNIDGVVIVTDAIINFNTIEDVHKKINKIAGKGIEVHKIFSIFLRERSDKKRSDIYHKNIKKTHYINDRYEANICTKDRKLCRLYDIYKDGIYDNMPS